jgi:hypothetical protein
MNSVDHRNISIVDNQYGIIPSCLIKKHRTTANIYKTCLAEN